MTLQKTTMFRFFTQSGRLLTQFLVIWGCQRAPAEDIFAYFFGCLFRLGFLTIFYQKIQKMKNGKSWFRYIIYSVSWGSPCPEKCKDVYKKTTKKTTIFCSKVDKKTRKSWLRRPSQQKSTKRLPRERHFSKKSHFWSILGSQERPQNPPRGAGIIDPRGLGRHPGAIWEPFWMPGRFFLDFDVILAPFWVPSDLDLGSIFELFHRSRPGAKPCRRQLG